MRTAVVILNYNGKAHLEQFLPLVIAYTPGASVVVADNRSTDGSVEMLHRQFPQVQLIQLPANYGFSGGYNAALKQVNADCYVLLNSDVEVTPGWLSPLTGLLEREPQVAACQPKIRSYRHPDQFEYAGAAGGFLDRWGYPFCRGRLFDTYEEDHGQYDDPIAVDWATGACLVIRADAYWEAGGLDEHFFAHMEEIDLCWRLRNLGHLVKYCGESTVFHVGGGTLDKSHPRKTFLNFRNGIGLLYKNLPGNQLLPVIFVRLVLDGVAACWMLLLSGPAHFWAVVRAHFNFYLNLRLWRNARKKAQGIRRGKAHLPSYRGGIVWDYFIRRKKVFSDLSSGKFQTVG